MVYSEYTWIFVLSIPVSFFVAFGIGANDLANSFGSSVGTKALKMWQAVIVAGICEFLGAFFLGASVTDTVKSGVVNVSQFRPVPGLFLYGFFAAMCSAAIWDNLGEFLEGICLFVATVCSCKILTPHSVLPGIPRVDHPHHHWCHHGFRPGDQRR